MKYRSNTDIIAAILQIAAAGAVKTHITYRANLSYVQIRKYLALLIDNGLLSSRTEEKKKFTTTEEGRYFLQTYEERGRMLYAEDVGAKLTNAEIQRSN